MNIIANRGINIAVVTPWPPMRSGISDYSYKLYSRLADLYKDLRIVILVQKTDNANALKVGNMIIEPLWKPNMMAPFRIFKETLSLQVNALHIQYDFSVLGSPLNVLFLPLVLFVLKCLKRFKVVLTLHEIPPLYTSMKEEDADNAFLRLYIRSSIIRAAVLLYLKFLLLGANVVIVHNPFMKKALEMQGLVHQCEKVVIIPHGTDIKESSVHIPDKNKKGKVITFFGYLRPSKGLKYLIEAFSSLLVSEDKRYEGIMLRIIGGRAQQSSLKGLVLDVPDQYKDKIQLVGYVNEEDLDKLLVETDIFVLPYIDDFIGSSRALHRIAYLGRPVICTKIPRFVGELRDGFNCMFVKPRDSRSLAKAIETLLESESFAKLVGNNLRKSLIQWSWGRVAELHYKLYVGVC
ncbi:glycosyltransferase [Desulfurococcus mucosus]|uniref:glycosyltransferase n=1 Tax=Desulfurococcus mucosus TaxID=2275 RepID=UPI00064EDEDC|nr:glycosyltransferase [Desulfurococcus mucosus]